jgi:hypothetical protein
MSLRVSQRVARQTQQPHRYREDALQVSRRELPTQHVNVTTTSYVINEQKARDRIIAACDRPPISELEVKANNAILIFSPTAFTVVRTAVHDTYKIKEGRSNIEYKVKKDGNGKVESEVYKIYENLRPSYTINLYRTSSCLVVNGRMWKEHFIERDYLTLKNYIENNSADITNNDHDMAMALRQLQVGTNGESDTEKMDPICIICEEDCLSDSVICDVGDHWVHYNCDKLSKKKIKDIEKNKDTVHSCRVCTDSINVALEWHNDYNYRDRSSPSIASTFLDSDDDEDTEEIIVDKLPGVQPDVNVENEEVTINRSPGAHPKPLEPLVTTAPHGSYSPTGNDDERPEPTSNAPTGNDNERPEPASQAPTGNVDGRPETASKASTGNDERPEPASKAPTENVDERPDPAFKAATICPTVHAHPTVQKTEIISTKGANPQSQIRRKKL